MNQQIIRDFSRPKKTHTNSFRTIPTSIISDCLNRYQAMDATIKPLKLGYAICGPAFTIQTIECCNWAIHQALNLAKKGDVLIVSARGSTNSSVWGYLMTIAAEKKGVEGIVIDGCIRDYKENLKSKLPIYSKGVCLGGSHKNWTGNLNVPVSCGGIAVLPGDIIVGDDDGIVVIPQNLAEITLKDAKNRLETEKIWFKEIEEGKPTLEILNLKSV